MTAIVVVLGVNSAWAESKSDLRSVQLSGIMTQQDSGSTQSVHLRYSPSWELREAWRAGVSVGVSPQIMEDETQFVGSEVLANAQYRLNERWSAQASAGVQSWKCDYCRDTTLAAGLAGTYQVKSDRLPPLQNIWLQYLYADQEKTMHQLLLGLGFGW